MATLAPPPAIAAAGCARYSLSIRDEATGRIEGLDRLPDSPFRRFILAISAHLRARGLGMQCQVAPGEAPVALVFERLALAGPAPAPPAPASPAPADAACLLASPWLDLAAWPGSALRLRAHFRWNERQFLRDRLALAQPPIPPPPEPAAPMPAERFQALARAYAETVLHLPSPEARPAAQRAVAGRIPADLLWLFRHAWQSDLMPFATEAQDAMDRLIARAAPGYTALVTALLDRCLPPAPLRATYAGLADLPAGMLPDAYRLAHPH